MESEWEESECFRLFWSVYDCIAYNPVKTRLLELEVEAEKPTNHKAQNWTLW